MPKPLTAAFVARVKPESKVRRYGDGGNLYLVVKPGGRKSWIFRMVQPSGKRTDKGLGGYPAVSLAEARAAALDARHTLQHGGEVRTGRRRAASPTFDEALERVIAINAPTWTDARSEQQWRASLDTYAGGLANRPVNTITTAHVLAVLEPIWHTKRETAKRVRQRISSVLRWSIASGYRVDDAAGDALTAVLPRAERQVRHLEAIPYGDLAEALAKVRGGGGPAALAVEFAALTAARRDEVRLARWSEIDEAARVWVVPASRMKRRREHRIPLAPRALQILAEARAYGEAYVFPGAKAGRPLGPGAMRALWKAKGCVGTLHGLRTSFRTWTQEQTNTPNEIAEHALAHVVGAASARAYARSDMFEKRRKLMDRWSNYLAESGGS